jgi:uncharacterized protein (DUF58 family)
VHWKATARTGEMQVKVNDPSTTAQVTVVLNLNTYQNIWQGVDLDRVEAVVSVAGSLALWALERGYAVGMCSNGVISGSENASNAPRLPPSAGPRQSVMLLEHLARLAFAGRFSATDILLDEAKRIGAGRTLVFVTAVLSPELVAVLTSRPFVNRVSVVYTGRSAAPVVRGLPIYLAVPPTRESQYAVS